MQRSDQMKHIYSQKNDEQPKLVKLLPRPVVRPQTAVNVTAIRRSNSTLLSRFRNKGASIEHVSSEKTMRTLKTAATSRKTITLKSNPESRKLLYFQKVGMSKTALQLVSDNSAVNLKHCVRRIPQKEQT